MVTMQRKTILVTAGIATTAFIFGTVIICRSAPQPYIPQMFLRPLFIPQAQQTVNNSCITQMDAWTQTAIERDLRQQGLKAIPVNKTTRMLTQYKPDAKLVDLDVAYNMPGDTLYARRELLVHVCKYPLLGEHVTYEVVPNAAPQQPVVPDLPQTFNLGH